MLASTAARQCGAGSGSSARPLRCDCRRRLAASGRNRGAGFARMVDGLRRHGSGRRLRSAVAARPLSTTGGSGARTASAWSRLGRRWAVGWRFGASATGGAGAGSGAFSGFGRWGRCVTWSRYAITSPTSAVSPARLRIFVMTPAAGEGTSSVAFSVSSSTRFSSRQRSTLRPCTTGR